METFARRTEPSDVLKQRVTIVTGASSGIGRELALQLAMQHGSLVLAARSEQALEEVASVCRQRGARVQVVRCDVSIEDDCRRLIEESLTAFGRIDLLINNAGISMRARFDEIEDPTLFERIMRINYLGAVWCTMFALPHLKKSRGAIVAVASVAGKIGVPRRSAYAATKHAMIGFFDSLRLELRSEGVGVTIVSPGYVRTGIGRRALGADGKPLGDASADRHEMSAEQCASIILKAAAKRQAEVVMTWQARAAMWAKLIAPRWFDRMVLRKARS